MRIFDEERAELIRIVCNDIFGEKNVNVEKSDDTVYPSVVIHVEEIGQPIYMRCYLYI